MKVILDETLKEHKEVEVYRDDLCVGVTQSLADARAKLRGALAALEEAGFPSKPALEVVPGQLQESVVILGLRVYSGDDGALWWRRREPLEERPARTLKEVAGVLGKFAPGNLPILGWARPAAQLLRSLVGREAAAGWKRQASEELQQLTMEFMELVTANDPAGGRWSYRQEDRKVWTVCCDASQDALGVVLFVGDTREKSRAIEDFCWLNPTPRQINLLETESVLRGLTQVVKYATKSDHVLVVVDSKTTYAWVRKALDGEIFRCRSMSGILLTRRLSLIHELAQAPVSAQESEPEVEVVTSENNLRRSSRSHKAPKRLITE